jgi:UDP-GlcNAc:undecaprenyl-phosphate/decaprenyl-phosphate GlcNAc-1-phosphate transferase
VSLRNAAQRRVLAMGVIRKIPQGDHINDSLTDMRPAHRSGPLRSLVRAPDPPRWQSGVLPQSKDRAAGGKMGDSPSILPKRLYARAYASADSILLVKGCSESRMSLHQTVECRCSRRAANLQGVVSGTMTAVCTEFGDPREHPLPHYTMHLLNTFLLTVVLISILDRLAARLGLLDVPQGRKMHEHAVPATGGLAMFGAFMLPAINLELPLDVYWNFLIGASMLVLIGVLDDMLTLGPWTKLGGQIASALVVMLPGDHLIDTSTLLGFSGAEFPQLKIVLTACFIVGVVNAFNMLDGLDGLAGGVAGAALLLLAVVAWFSGMTGALVHLLLLLCAVLGFLFFNMRHPWRRRASAYMGDAGSMMLGAAVAFFIIDLSVGPRKAAPLPTLLWFCALPVFDTLILIVRRLVTGRNPLCGDRRHLHHFLLRAGLSPCTAATILIAVCFLLGAVGLVGWRLGVSAHLMLLGLLVPFTLHAYIVFYGWKVIERLRVIRSADDMAAADSVAVVGD